MHDRSLAPICGFLRENSKLRRPLNSSNELDAAHDRLSADVFRINNTREFFKKNGVTRAAASRKRLPSKKYLQPLCDSTHYSEHQYD
ncbi:hypothetical protein [Pseudomonas sp. PSKL.D1]|uniref:hypothetical protein n=1 Tax=Pseudomonas sp. PSKL.D1 TaxID=3029060 RepID=UPI0023813F50|nr:hypothetical protein [Pseudomonas sp. PSKL.D1]WDY60323.1 hypothetical protein PVV54_12075 [Pseudomonas sp. PSKL.D1]